MQRSVPGTLGQLLTYFAVSGWRSDPQRAEQHIRQTEAEIQQGALVSEIASLSPHSALVADTLLTLDTEDKLPAKMDAFSV